MDAFVASLDLAELGFERAIAAVPRPTHFIYDEASDTIRCPGGQTMRPSGKHTRNRAIRYRTPACKMCELKPRCTPGAQRAIHRLWD